MRVRKIKDTCDDPTFVEVVFGEILVRHKVGDDETSMYYTPRQSKKLRKALKRAEKVARGAL